MAIQYGDFSLLRTVNVPRPKLLFSEYYEVRLRSGKPNGALYLNVFESYIEVRACFTTPEYRPQVHEAFAEIMSRRSAGWGKPIQLVIHDKPDAHFHGTAEDLASFKASLVQLAKNVRATVTPTLTPLV